MTILSEQIREQDFIHDLLDDAADEIEAMEKQIYALEMSLAETEALEEAHGERIAKLMAENARLRAALEHTQEDTMEFRTELTAKEALKQPATP